MNGKKAKALRRAGVRGGPAPRVATPLRHTVCGCGRKIVVNVGEDGTVNRRNCGQCGPTGLSRTQLRALADAMRRGKLDEAKRLAGSVPALIECPTCDGYGRLPHGDVIADDMAIDAGNDCAACAGTGSVPNPALDEQPA